MLKLLPGIQMTETKQNPGWVEQSLRGIIGVIPTPFLLTAQKYIACPPFVRLVVSIHF